MSKGCPYEFAPGVRCERDAGHDEPFYPYLDYGQFGMSSDILSQGSNHVATAPAPELPPKWTGLERRE